MNKQKGRNVRTMNWMREREQQLERDRERDQVEKKVVMAANNCH